MIVHDQMPCTNPDHDQYFSELFDIWFPHDNLPQGFDYETSKQTFMAGGYYRHDFPNEDISILAMNSIYFMTENKCEKGDA